MMLTVLYCKPGAQPVPMIVPAGLRAFEELVGGYTEQDQSIGEGVVAIYGRRDNTSPKNWILKR